MPRDAYISPYAIGGLNGHNSAQNIISRIALGRPFNGEIVFYSSLFQAGIDRVVCVDEELRNLETKRIPQKRLHVVKCKDSLAIRKSIQSYFDFYLTDGWFKQREHLPTLSLWSFLGDLLTSFRLRKPLLRTIDDPDLAPLAVMLPLEILSPVQTLLQSSEKYESVVAVPTQEISKDRLKVVEEIMTSAPYTAVAEIHHELTQKPSAAKSCLKHLEKASQALYWRWKDFLRLKSSMIRVIRHLPDLVEAMSGKKSVGAVKPLTELLATMIRKDHGLLIYDASPLLEESLVNLLHQVVRAPKPSAEEVERRVADYNRDKGLGRLNTT